MAKNTLQDRGDQLVRMIDHDVRCAEHPRRPAIRVIQGGYTFVPMCKQCLAQLSRELNRVDWNLP